MSTTDALLWVNILLGVIAVWQRHQTIKKIKRD
jgi:hypothetical protein